MSWPGGHPGPGAEGEFPHVRAELPHGDGAVHPLDLPPQGGEVLRVGLRGLNPGNEGHGNRQHRHPVVIVVQALRGAGGFGH